MHSLKPTSNSHRVGRNSHTATCEPKLAPSTRYYICKLLRQASQDESTELLEFRLKLTENNCADLDQKIGELYPDKAELTKAILRLENLVYFSQSLNTQSSIYSGSINSAIDIKHEILYLLGFSTL